MPVAQIEPGGYDNDVATCAFLAAGDVTNEGLRFRASGSKSGLGV